MNTKLIILVIILNLEILASAPNWKFIDSKYFTKDDVTMTINCIDSSDCILGSAYATSLCKLLRTTDAGKTWKLLYDESKTPPYPNPYYFVNMKYFSKTNLYIVYRDGYIKHSKNLGKNWDTIPISGPYKIGQGLKYFSMSDTLTGMVCDVFGYYITQDGWITTQFIKDTLGSITGCWMHSIDTFAVLRIKSINSNPGGSIYSHTSDRGKTWKHDSIADLYYLHNVFFLDRQHGWIAASLDNGVGDQKYDAIFFTNNGGSSWTLIYKEENQPIFGLQDIAFSDYNNGVAVGAFGKILRTTDGGISWFQENLDKNPYISINTPLTMNIAYAGNTPIIGTWGSGLYRLEDNETIVIDNEINNHNFIDIFPTPFEDKFTIATNISNIDLTNVKIYDILGNNIECLIDLIDNNRVIITPISKLETGIYFYKLINGIGVYNGKIIKR